MRIFGLGPMELGLILLVVLILFGPKQLPKLGKMFGKTMKNVREGMDGINDDGEDIDELPAPKAEAAPAPKAEDKVEAKSEDK